MKKARKLVIHIGLNRTGTTFLQTKVFPFLKNVNYIPLYLNNKYACNPFMLKTEDGKTTLISNENFCFFIKHTDVDKDTKYYADSEIILKRLKKVFPDASIILCVREKDNWLKSVYNNSVKNGYVHSFEHFLKHTECVDIDSFVKTLKKLFDDVFIYCFEDFIKDKEKIVADICRFIGTDVPSDIDYRKVNKSLSNKDIKKMLIFNKLFVSKLNPNGRFKVPSSLYYFIKRIIYSYR